MSEKVLPDVEIPEVVQIKMNQAFDQIMKEDTDMMNKEMTRKGMYFTKKAAAVAACAGIILTGSTVAVASNAFGIKDAIFTKTVVEQPTPADEEKILTENGAEVVSTEANGDKVVRIEQDGVVVEMIQDASAVAESQENIGESAELLSLSGFGVTPESKALAEWNAFIAGYDQDGSIRNENDKADDATWGQDVALYAVYSDEMAQKLREIANKYQLQLHTETKAVTDEELNSMLGGTLCSEATDKYGAITFENGTFQFDAEYKMDDAMVMYQFSRKVRGTFDLSYLNVGSQANFVEEAYTTKNGTEVMLANSDNKAIIMANLDNSFVVVNVEAGDYRNETGKNFTMDQLKEMADSFNFELVK